MHELGNLIVALQFCLRQLGGRQRTEELEGVVRNGLEACEQGIAAFRKVHEAVRAPREPSSAPRARDSAAERRLLVNIP
jgi:hypothetical protein